MSKAENNEKWTLVIKPKTSWWDLGLGEVWRYRDLILLFVRRDFVSVYKQTVLGPVWFFLQPLLSSFVFSLIFQKGAGLSYGAVPGFLFILGGQVSWGYFADSLSKTATTFTANAGIFGKVYFPRLVSPISVVLSSILKFGVQFILFLSVWVYFMFQGVGLEPNMHLLLLPVLIIMMALLGLGFGIIISSLTTKYRDFQHLVKFGLQLAMFGSPAILHMSIFGELAWLIRLNPMTSIIETFRYGFCGGEWMVGWGDLAYTAIVMAVTLIGGVLLFHKVEKNFMDTV